jgi:hypothetical protein
MRRGAEFKSTPPVPEKESNITTSTPVMIHFSNSFRSLRVKRLRNMRWRPPGLDWTETATPLNVRQRTGFSYSHFAISRRVLKNGS